MGTGPRRAADRAQRWSGRRSLVLARRLRRPAAGGTTDGRGRASPRCGSGRRAEASTVVTHDRDPQKQATRWVWTGPAEVHTLHDLARLNTATATGLTATPAARPGA